MAWYNKILGREEVEEKLNPAQPYYDHKIESSREMTYSYELAYEQLEIVNRGVNMIVDDVSEITTKVGPPIPINNPYKGVKRAKPETS